MGFPAQETSTDALRKLQAVTDAALAHLTLDELLDELLERIRDALEADTSALLMLDSERQELVARAAKGLEEEVERGTRIPYGKGFAGRIAATRDLVMIEDVDHSYVLNPILHEKGVKSLLGAPLLVGDKVLGVVHVGTLTPRVFSADDADLLRVVSARAALAIDRALAYDEVVRVTQLQRDFVSLAAHELRTPAATVYGLAATLAQRQLPPDMVEQLQQTLHEQAERMSRLVEQLLDMSRLDAAAIRINPGPIPLRTELQHIVKATALGREHQVEVDAPDEIVVADRAVLERVIGNLLTNALRYGAPPIRVVARQTDSHLRITVRDSGPGIDPEFVPQLFDRFQRSDAARQSGTGAGLGLSIARLYARAHGGDVVYERDKEPGARFDLVVPT
ncbi:MAG TPA: GAF domain-containing sensor histidine kinase [Gaiellaceae bacterium]|nr:GAF domain-containing sensor histidine kinase [Gaiellaceae bacterium]